METKEGKTLGANLTSETRKAKFKKNRSVTGGELSTAIDKRDSDGIISRGPADPSSNNNRSESVSS